MFQAIRTSLNAKSSMQNIFILLLFTAGVFLILNIFEENAKQSPEIYAKLDIGKFFWKTQQEKLENSEKKSNQDLHLKIILYWNGWNSYMGDQPLIDGMCPVTSCIFTQDRTLFNQSQVVLFSADKTFSQFLPSYREPSQRFIFVSSEPHVKIQDDSFILDDTRGRFNFFNWTMTYRTDSDIILRDFLGATVPNINKNYRHENFKSTKSVPFSWMKRPSHRIQTLKKKKLKTKLIAWFSSECKTSVKREEYILQLKDYIPVDIYGKCGNMSCGISCNEMLRTDYKFYLAFEDSWCSDYVTAEFYRSLEYNTVPVVLGGADYDVFGPPHSFINALDFPSVKALAEYLLILNDNEELYVKYFDWQNHYKVVIPALGGWCDLCRMAHDSNLPHKTYPDIKQWWVDEGSCLSNLTAKIHKY